MMMILQFLPSSCFFLSSLSFCTLAPLLESKAEIMVDLSSTASLDWDVFNLFFENLELCLMLRVF